MLKFKLFVVTKNEYDLIEDFINYYGKHFGYDNLIIIDNNSDNKYVLDIYEKYKNKGIILHNELRYDNTSQGEHFTKYMNKYKNECDWLIGLDTDEFLILSDNDKYTCTNLYNNLCNILNNIDKNVDKITCDYFNSYIDKNIIMYNKPVLEINKFLNRSPSRKMFFKSKNFISTINGNHDGETLNNKSLYLNSISLLHYHNTGFKRMIERAHNICIGYKYINNNDTDIQIFNKLKIHNSCFGIHRVKQLRDFMVKKILIDLFVKYIKRFPDENELLIHIKRFNINTVIKEFQNCSEAIKNKNIIFNVSNDDLEKMYFKDLNSMFFLQNNDSTFIEINCVSEFIKNIEH